jgi:parallel beta-helix repeat protein
MLAGALVAMGVLLAPALASAAPKVRVVHPGGSIQAAVDAVGAGGSVLVLPGTYSETVNITQPHVSLLGLPGWHGEGVVITNPGGELNGISVTSTANDILLSNFKVRGFDRNGVQLISVSGFTMIGLIAENNGSYGLYPALSSNGLMMGNTASGHGDAGIYVGQSSNVTIIGNTMYANVIGIEASNSSDILIKLNTCVQNTTGILAVLLPGRTVKTSARLTIRDNYVADNNTPNFADHGFAVACPAGTGILFVGVDDSIIENNTVENHAFLGVAVVTTLVLGQLMGQGPEAFADIEPFADHNRIIDNDVSESGTNPPALPFPAVDLLWDGTGNQNCWSDNTGVSYPSPLPPC